MVIVVGCVEARTEDPASIGDDHALAGVPPVGVSFQVSGRIFLQNGAHVAALVTETGLRQGQSRAGWVAPVQLCRTCVRET